MKATRETHQLFVSSASTTFVLNTCLMMMMTVYDGHSTEESLSGVLVI